LTKARSRVGLIGMPGIEKRVARFPQFYSRIGFVHEVCGLEEAEITELLNQGWVPVKPLKKSDYEAPARTPLQAQDGIPDQLPPFDIQAALVRNNGKPKLIRKLLRTFHDRYANAVSELQSHLNENKPEEAERLALAEKPRRGSRSQGTKRSSVAG
jgi:hypothetical protein